MLVIHTIFPRPWRRFGLGRKLAVNQIYMGGGMAGPKYFFNLLKNHKIIAELKRAASILEIPKIFQLWDDA